MTIRNIKWVLILLALLAIGGIVILNVAPFLDAIRAGSVGWRELNGFGRGFLPSLFVILISFFIIYPNQLNDLWIQRFIGGIILFSVPLLFGYFGMLGIFSLKPYKDLPRFSYYILFYILPFIVMIFLCLFLKEKINSSSGKIKKLLHIIMIISPFIVGIINLFLFFGPQPSIGMFSIKMLSVTIFPLVCLTIGIPAIINRHGMPKKLLFLTYVGMGLAHFSLALGYYILLYYSFIGE